MNALVFVMTITAVGFGCSLALVSRDLETRSELHLFVVSWIVVFLALVLYVIGFILFVPDRLIFSTDGTRYFWEMQQIAENPALWDPWQGHGPGYNVSAKMGYSYLAGTIMWLFGIDGLFVPLMINVVASILTAAAAFSIAYVLSSRFIVALLAFFLVALHPELLYWTARIVRENLAVLLVTLMFYSVLKGLLCRWYWLAPYFLIAFLSAAVLITVRAQLVYMLPIILFSALVVFWRHWLARPRVLMVLAVSTVSLYPLFVTFYGRLNSALNSISTELHSLSLGFLIDGGNGIVENLPRVLTLISRQEHGLMGFVLFPFSVMMFGFGLVGAYKIFSGAHGVHFKVGLVTIGVTVAYLLALAIFGSVNIRFRVNVVPLVLVLSALGFHWFWGWASSRGRMRRIHLCTDSH